MRLIAEFFFSRNIVFLVLSGGVAGIAVAERHLMTLPMAYFIAISVIAFMVLLTGRLKTSIYFGLALVALIAFISYAKMKWMWLALNIIDLYYFALNAGTLLFLVESFPHLVFAAVLHFFGAVCALFVLGWYERPSARNRRIALVAFPLSVILSILFQPREFHGIDDLMKTRYITSVFTSMKYLANFNDTVPLLDRLEREQVSANGSLPSGSICENLASKPDLFVVQAESVVPPEIYYDGAVPAVLKGAFNGPDRILRPLHVETYSGGTWITTTGFATGLSISDLGWLKSYSNFILDGRIRRSIVRSLADCGYHTVYFSPLPYSFVNEGNFMESIGFETFVDQYDMEAPTIQEGDDYYYAQALEYLKRFRMDDDRPVFMFILTMSAHSPWDYRHAPDRVVAGEPFSEDSDKNEFFRRLAMSRLDLADFKEQLHALDQPAILLEFGDHQPGSTLEYWEKREGPAPLANENSGAYLTSFQMHSIGTEIAAPVPVFDRLDVQFLGVTLLEVAGIPLGPVQSDLLNMRDQCQGRFKSCHAGGRLDAHYRCRLDQRFCSKRRPADKLASIRMTVFSSAPPDQPLE